LPAADFNLALVILVEVQRNFSKASPTNTLYTALIQTGNCDTDKALLIRLRCSRDYTQTRLDIYFVWVAHDDLADDIARAWGYVLLR